ncbi:MAG TPA: hypothetical protein DEP51_00225 [Clostridiales bacterium]|nr:hypothetical protein [Clostridiales bacterium]
MKYKNITGIELISAYPMPGIYYDPEIKQEEIDEYVGLYNKYNKMFIQYVLTKTCLKDLDEQMCKQREIKPLDETQMDLYQYCISDELKFLYIRNNMHIERLNELEKEFLKSVELCEGSFTPKQRAYIEKSFPKVIAEGEGNGKTIANYGNENVGFLAKDNSVVIGIRYNVKDPNDLQQVLNAKDFCQLIINRINLIEGPKIRVPMVGHRYSKFGVKIMHPKGRRVLDERN